MITIVNGAIFVELVFGLPGLGRLTVQALTNSRLSGDPGDHADRLVPGDGLEPAGRRALPAARPARRRQHEGAAEHVRSSLHRPTAPLDDEPPVSLWRDAWHRLRRNKLAVVGLVVVILLAFVAAFGPWLTPYDFLSQDLDARNQAPSLAHLFGTDDLGRDVLQPRRSTARARPSSSPSSVTAIAVAIGVALGAIAGFFGGWLDRVVMWLTDMTMSVPNLLLVVVINASLKPPIANWMEARYLATLNPFYRETIWVDFLLVFGSMALISWPPYARLVRAQVLSIRSRPYVTAARALGLTNRHHPHALRRAERARPADRLGQRRPRHRDGAGERLLASSASASTRRPRAGAT